MIVASFAQQYNIRFSKSLNSMQWEEFKTLLAGLGPDTPLGRMISIRSETNKDILKDYTPDMHRMRNEWLSKNAQKKSLDERNRLLEEMKNAFVAMAGGVGNNT